MPLLRNGRLADEDVWVFAGDDEPLPPDGTPTVVSVDRFTALHRDGQASSVSGVCLQPDEDAGLLQPWLHHLQLICIDFPVFTDGRGYSHSRLLRQRLLYAGEIRAVGDVRVDQIAFMARVGIDSFQFAEVPDPELIERVLHRHRQSYQPSYALAIAG